MVERIQKILSSRGIASRRHAEAMILAGRVSCNGVVCTLGSKADPEIDVIQVDGKPLPDPQSHVYLMLHKPRGYVTTLSDEKGRPNAAQLVADCGTRVYPVGRLDMDSEGLLIFTDDGSFANHLMHPKDEVNKTYLVSVRDFSEDNLNNLGKPIVLDGYAIRPPDITVISQDTLQKKAKIQIVIHEGRNRQVRRMCAMAGMRVIRLVRIQEGSLKLGNLSCGKWRYLTDDEVAALQE